MQLRHTLPCLVLCTAWLAGGASAAVIEPELPVPETPEALWEGAIGVIATYRPEYQGATERTVKLKPVVFLRYGRFTVSSGGGSFGTKRAGDIARGLSLSLLDSDRVRVSLGLRYDGGRSEAESGALAGLGDIPPTLRARIAAAWRLEGPWRLGVNWNVDAFGRGGGSYGELNGGWESEVSPGWVLTLGGSLSVAGDRYMQTYYGVSEEQAARTTYPVYSPSSGLREVVFAAGLRHQLSQEWILVGGVGLSRLLGPAAASPLTIDPVGWGINAGAVWRF
ncbi:MAG: MipA/OmpV family protein [Rubrivivax sp.]|nr:MipA/OmpV family protein [Rubrivivax sp.]